MLIKKYTPSTFEKSIIHKKIINKLKFITKENFSNTLFYGPSGTGKYILSLMFLQHLFGHCIYIKNNYQSMLNIYYSSVHYEIILTKNSNKTQELNDIIKNISSNYNISTNYHNIIIIKNINYLSKETFSLIKYLIENNFPIYFVLLSTTIANVPVSIKNLFLKIRIPKINNKECFELFNKVNLDSKLNFSKKQLEELLYKNKNNLIKIFFCIDSLNPLNQSNYIDTKLDDILDLIKMKKITNILKIRSKLYDLCSKNIDKSYIIKYCLNQILKITTDDKKKDLINKATDLQHKSIKSYKETIHIEYFLIYLMTY